MGQSSTDERDGRPDGPGESEGNGDDRSESYGPNGGQPQQPRNAFVGEQAEPRVSHGPKRRNPNNIYQTEKVSVVANGEGVEYTFNRNAKTRAKVEHRTLVLYFSSPGADLQSIKLTQEVNRPLEGSYRQRTNTWSAKRPAVYNFSTEGHDGGKPGETQEAFASETKAAELGRSFDPKAVEAIFSAEVDYSILMKFLTKYLPEELGMTSPL